MSEHGSKGKVLEIVTLGNILLKSRLGDFGCSRSPRVITTWFSPCFSGDGEPGCSQVGGLQVPTAGVGPIPPEQMVGWEGPWQSCCQCFLPVEIPSLQLLPCHPAWKCLSSITGWGWLLWSSKDYTLQIDHPETPESFLERPIVLPEVFTQLQLKLWSCINRKCCCKKPMSPLMIKGLILLLLVIICSMEGCSAIPPTEVGAVYTLLKKHPWPWKT